MHYYGPKLCLLITGINISECSECTKRGVYLLINLVQISATTLSILSGVKYTIINTVNVGHSIWCLVIQ